MLFLILCHPDIRKYTLFVVSIWQCLIMVYVRSRIRIRLTDEPLKIAIRIATTEIKADIEDC